MADETNQQGSGPDANLRKDKPSVEPKKRQRVLVTMQSRVYVELVPRLKGMDSFSLRKGEEKVVGKDVPEKALEHPRIKELLDRRVVLIREV